jgi:hypothetical protein
VPATTSGDVCGDVGLSGASATASGDVGGDVGLSGASVTASGDVGGDVCLSSNSRGFFGMAATFVATTISSPYASCIPPPHYYRSSEDEVENGKDERDMSNYLMLVHF